MRFGRRYHLIRSLGEGGMGAVFQAWDEELAVVVAIKVIRPESLKDPAAARDLERRFKRELLLARNVTHKNVVRIHDLGEIDGIKYITMPYIHGGDLARLIANEGRLSVPRALNIARQIAAGLVAAHEAGIVHRDLKPGNILLDEEDRALITDFGIARSVTGTGGGTMAGTIVGTLEYMAPEQAQGSAVDHRADIYAFGLHSDGHAGGPASRRAHGKRDGGALRPHVEGAGAGAVDRSFDSRRRSMSSSATVSTRIRAAGIRRPRSLRQISTRLAARARPLSLPG